VSSSDPKVVVITGASGGIGAALARRLGRAGCRLVLAARRGAELRQVASEAGVRAGEGLAVVTDVTRRADVEQLRDEALATFGAIDVWVNNAGRGVGVRVLELTDEQFDEMMAVNVKSALYGMQAVVPHFLARGAGHLINVSSYLGRVPLATHRSAYNAAKAALNALTANLRVDLRREHPGTNVHVSLVMPGLVATDFAQNALGGTPAPPPPLPGGVVQPRQTADEVAAMIAELIERPRAELYTSPAHAELTRRYYEDVEAFERAMTA
jgi:NAD(P)-dependent dehydrogenase (short-subunit alcohol dehydrogenase family)